MKAGNRLKIWGEYILAACIGALAVIGQAPLHIWPITLFSLANLYISLRQAAFTEKPRKSGFFKALSFALGYFGASLFWVGAAFIARGPAFIPIMPPMVFALALILALFWAFAASYFTYWHSFKLNPPLRLPVWGSILAFTSVFTLAELARGHIFGGLPWNLTGYIFAAGTAPSQIAAYINIYGLSCVVFFIAACLGQSLYSFAKNRQLRQSLMQAITPSFAALLALIMLYGYGNFRLAKAQLDQEQGADIVQGVKLRLVSVVFDQADQFDPQKSHDILNRFFLQSLAPGIEDVTHIVWPEGAVQGLAMESYAFLQSMGRALVQYDSTPPVWLLQSLRLETENDPNSGAAFDNYYNSSAAIEFDQSGNPTVSAFNDKYKLVPFGEFIPGGKWLEKRLPVISSALSSMTPAAQKTLSDFPGLPRLSAQICYESIFPALTPIDQNHPAQLILTQSNDAWYGKSWGPLQHANMARYRAIEEGVPMVRVASNGLTGIVNPYGQMPIKLTSSDESHIDTTLPKALKKHNNTKLITFILGLLNLIISLLCAGMFTRLQHS